MFTVVFQEPEGTQIARACAEEGQSILDIAHNHKVDLEGMIFCVFPNRRH